jgi:hypothetical protein
LDDPLIRGVVGLGAALVLTLLGLLRWRDRGELGERPDAGLD